MKMSKFSWAALALFAAAAGCNNNPQTANTSGDGGSNSGGTAQGENPSTASFDNSLKHNGFTYMGFGRNDELTYEYQELEGAPGQEGTEAIEVKSSEKDKAVVQINRAGALSRLGTETYEVRPDGVYLTIMGLGQLKAPMLAIPGDVKVGSKWTSTLETTGTGSSKYQFSINNVAEKEEDIKVKAGSYKALLVTGTGTLSQGGNKPQKIQYKTWYAKDLGTVLMRIELVDDKGVSKKSSVELVAVGKTEASDKAPAKPEAAPATAG